MSKKQEEQKVEAPQDFIVTNHQVKYSARYRGHHFEIRCPLVDLKTVVAFLDFFTKSAQKTLSETEAEAEAEAEAEKETVCDNDFQY